MMEVYILGILLLLSFGIFMVPAKIQYYYTLGLQVILICLTSVLTWQAFGGSEPIQLKILSLPSGDINLVIDKISGFFIFVINLTVLTGALFANGYLAPYRTKKTKTEMAWHFFNFFLLHLSMLMVVLLREGISFLVFWELMSVSTFFLIIFESEQQEIKEAGIKFLIQMHIALAFLLAGFLVSSTFTGQRFGFDSLAAYFGASPVFPVFMLFFIGFGIKAGFIPLHSWLPHAHPAAPSHISGVMSGVMIKMGIYGIIRTLTYIHTELLSVGMLILIISAFSGITGVVIAIVQHDFKRLLAYHSIENIGIIGIGIGIGVIGLAIGNPVLASLGFAGGLLHVLNHSLFKSLLFYSAGSIYQQTHTKNIEQLGGLMKKMPATAVFFLIGAIAISGLPPFNGFISEFLIYSGLFKSLSNNNLLLSFVLLGGIVSLVIIGGLAVYCFTKVFSIIFLGNPRSELTANAHEVKPDMLIPKYLIAFFIVVIGVMPFIVIGPLSAMTNELVGDTSILRQSSISLNYITLSLLILTGLSTALWLLKKRMSRNRAIVVETTWGCGYTGANPAVHQYTATSYADYIARKAKLLVGAKKHFKPLSKDDIFPAPTRFDTHSSDVFEDNLILKPVRKLLAFLERIAVLQTGNIQDYLLYAILFVIFISLITILNII